MQVTGSAVAAELCIILPLPPGIICLSRAAYAIPLRVIVFAAQGALLRPMTLPASSRKPMTG